MLTCLPHHQTTRRFVQETQRSRLNWRFLRKFAQIWCEMGDDLLAQYSPAMEWPTFRTSIANMSQRPAYRPPPITEKKYRQYRQARSRDVNGMYLTGYEA